MYRMSENHLLTLAVMAVDLTAFGWRATDLMPTAQLEVRLLQISIDLSTDIHQLMV